jgi:hypothetical protein
MVIRAGHQGVAEVLAENRADMAYPAGERAQRHRAWDAWLGWRVRYIVGRDMRFWVSVEQRALPIRVPDMIGV